MISLVRQTRGAYKIGMRHRLEIQQLSVMRGDSLLIHDLSFSIAAGEMIWLAGDNGSGKTSLLRCLAGFLPAFSGDITYGGAPWQRSKDDLPLIWHGHRRGLAPALTGREALADHARLFGGQLPAFDDPDADRFEIARFIDLPVRVLSFGQAQRLALSRLLITSDGPAPIWLLDEPNSGLDGHSRAALNAVMADHQRAGGRIVIASHLPLEGLVKEGLSSDSVFTKLDLSADEAR